ncbi:cation-translocating P-type ATPase [Chondromyces apiculatus]|uniref:Calcium-transporting ATPase n=1 Tax=Chondromyces apiculatus DSM 436 TaxID=1192034 RepID=A0A017TIY2_9BACT|nr:cation-translocating P-type ATPase [Chondromyces apiculatus]EYF08541.1 calcium-transporting ATPase [Chondromyces apiculatus DSM 436]
MSDKDPEVARNAGEPRGGATDPSRQRERERGSELTASGAPVYVEEVSAFLERLAVSSTNGMSDEEATRRLAEHGPNKLPDPPKKSAILRLVEQFANPLVLTLLAAAVIAVVVGLTAGQEESFLSKFGDAIAILLIVILNAFLGYYQERRAEAALDALQKLSAPNARVRRGGRSVVISAQQVVPGDILELEAGDAVPADARLVQTIDLATEEAALTGESAATGKDALAVVPADAPLGDRLTMVFTGTSVVRGKARAVVTSTGVETELGRIGEMIRAVGEQKTPLEERLDKFGSIILKVCLALSVVLLGWGLIRGGRPLHELLLEAVSLAVAAIPEGLPAITTITLALGMQRMARRGAIVRKLPAVETLGAATIIASDKTGTLTQNEMTVRQVFAGGQLYTVTGEGYEPEGEILDTQKNDVTGELPAPLHYLLSTVALCNNAHLDRKEERWIVVGDPTEGALLTLAAKGDLPRESLAPSHSFVHELPFDSDRKRMTVITRDSNGREIAHVKGSIDALLPLCVKVSTNEGVRGMEEADRKAITEEADRMSAKALRVLAVCRRVRVGKDEADVERELTFLGLAAMMDPPRAGVKEAVATCTKAGIRAVMITGDHRLTATAIAQEIGLWEEGDETISGTELGAMSDDDLAARIMTLRVFARTTAEQKLRIVRAFKARGHVVAMTGDGVNDAPALREAHIGVAMGRGGTDVARQAADLVLADDNFATIVEAVREGRSIYRNIQKFIFFLLSSNMGLLVAVFVVSFFGKWPPLTPLMILWINLVTNGLPALALGVDPPDAHLMREAPRPPDEGLLKTRDYLGIAFVGAVMGLSAIFLYGTSPQDEPSLLGARAMAFSLLALSPLFHAWSCRSPSISLFSSRPFLSVPLLLAVLASAAIHLVAVLVPGLRPVFRTYAMTGEEWALLLGLAALIIPAVEIAKFFYRRFYAAELAPPPMSLQTGAPSRRGRKDAG